MYKIFDAHVHVYPSSIAERAVKGVGDFYNYVPECDGSLQGLLNGCKAGLRGFLFLTVATNAKQVEKINTVAADNKRITGEKGFKSLAFGGIHQDMTPEEIGSEISRCVEIGIDGFKIHPDIQGVSIDSKALFPLYEEASSRGLPVCFHMGDRREQYKFSAPERLKKVLEYFPRLRVIAAHFGGYGVWDEALEKLKNTSAVFDTSSTLKYLSIDKVNRLISSYGTERLLFGTDYPSISLNGELERFAKADLTERQREDILYNNAQRYFDL